MAEHLPSLSRASAPASSAGTPRRTASASRSARWSSSSPARRETYFGETPESRSSASSASISGFVRILVRFLFPSTRSLQGPSHGLAPCDASGPPYRCSDRPAPCHRTAHARLSGSARLAEHGAHASGHAVPLVHQVLQPLAPFGRDRVIHP